jgi:hypothetical protein
MNQRRSLPKQFFMLLKEEIILLSTMVDDAKQQQQALTAMDADTVYDIAVKQSSSSRKMQELEMKRIEILATIFATTTQEASTMSMTDIIALAVEEQEPILEKMKLRLRESTEALQELTRTNRILTDRSRQFFKETIKVMTNGGMSLYNRKA